MMSQFGKNPPWARNVGPINQTAGLALTQPQLELVPQVYGQAAVATPTMFSIQPGIALPTTLASSHVATVTYPSPRPVAASALQHKQRVFTGTVTKLHENFGFVDEDVFFQTSCVNGQQPNLGDRVLVEATYNATMPVKWNATRIQVLSTMMQTGNTASASQGFQAVIAQPVYSSIASVSQGGSAFHSVGYKSMAIGSSSIPNLLHHAPPLMSKQTQAVHGRGSNLGSGTRRTEASAFKDRVDRVWEPASSRERRERRSPRKRSRSPRRSRSPLRSRSPQKSPVSSKSPPRSRSPHSPSSRAKSPQRARRSIRITSRYTVQIPKISLDLKEANLMTLRSRYNNMYIPSDFFNASFLWTDVFPAHRPFTLGNSCDFHIFSKSVTPPTKLDSILDPLDADYRFNVKVMLLTCPTLEDLYHKSCALAEDASEVRESFQHPTRLIQFLVGLKGKGEPVALGGPWSPSLDGSNPEENPRVLINTAVRTTKALTGIDLSRCMQWFRFTEIRYYRPEEVRKGRTVPAHTETVVIFLPDVWTCRPTHLEWQTLMAEYRKLLDVKLSTEEFRLEPKEEEVETEKDTRNEKRDPTHHSDLDPKTMKLTDLREELECRNLSSKGLKSQLIARLMKALRSEEEKETEEIENKCLEEDKNKDEDDIGRMDIEEDDKQKQKEREREALIRQYTLPDNPAILVHPSPTAKSGKFECTVMSLSLLLDYRLEDNKEHVFEVSLFAEMFNEMLMRDFGFRIYKHFVSAPEIAEDERRDRDDHKDKARTKGGNKNEDSKVINDRMKSETAYSSLKEPEESANSEHARDTKAIRVEDNKISFEFTQNSDKGQSLEAGDDGKVEDDVSCVDQVDEVSDDTKDERGKMTTRFTAKHESIRLITSHPDLLLAFVYFDQSHAGYLVDRDAEEIIYTLGLQLSRAQVKKLVSRFASKDIINYRKLTDNPQNEKRKTDATAVAPNVDDRALAIGNCQLLNRTESAAQKRPRMEVESESSEGASTESVILHNGAFVDVDSLMFNLSNSEKSRVDMETKLKELQQELDDLRTSCGSRELVTETMSSEILELKKKLLEQNCVLDQAESSSKNFHNLLLRAHSTLLSLDEDIKEAISERGGKATESVRTDD